MRKIWFSFIVFALALVLSACSSGASSESTPKTEAASHTSQKSQMKHDADPMSDNSYDVHFIDSTLEHHAAVLTMAQQALVESNSVALKDLAQQTMISTQKEIDLLTTYRNKNHPSAAMMKDDMDMGPMGISTDANKSFERRYAEAMIAHHQGSIEMAREALAKVGHEELKQFATSMLAVEEAEVALLQQFVK
jgi:uncharacterized protein (DUF305 family)